MNVVSELGRLKRDPPTANSHALWPYVLAMSIWGFDFRAAAAGVAAAFQGLLLGIYLLCCFSIVKAAGRRGLGIGPLWVLILFTLIFMIESSVVAVINGQRGYSITINLIPPFLYLSASAITFLTLSMAKDDTRPFINGLGIACIVSGLGHLLVVSMTSGIDLSSSRFEVLSGAIVPSLGVIVVGLAQRLSRLDVFVMLLNLSIMLLSVTRTLVIVLGVQLATLMIALPEILFRRSLRKGIGIFCLIAVVVVALDIGTGTGLTARWTERLFVSQRLGAEPSGLMRIAETRFMWDRFTTSIYTVLFGNGLAAVTSAIGREDAQVAVLVGRGSSIIHMIGIGHENYVSILYVAGLLGGGGLLVLQVLNGIQSLVLIRKVQRRPSVYSESDAHVATWGGVIVTGMLTIGLLSGTFGDRGECLWFGVGTGMLYWARSAAAASKSNAAVRP